MLALSGVFACSDVLVCVPLGSEGDAVCGSMKLLCVGAHTSVLHLLCAKPQWS